MLLNVTIQPCFSGIIPTVCLLREVHIEFWYSIFVIVINWDGVRYVSRQ